MIESFSELQMSQRQIIVRRCPFGPHNCGGGACGAAKNGEPAGGRITPMIGRITKFITILLMRENGLQAILFMVNTWTPTRANFCPRVRLSCRDFSAAINPHFEGGAECLLKLMSCNPAGPKDNTKQQLQRIRTYPGPTKIGPRPPPPHCNIVCLPRDQDRPHKFCQPKSTPPPMTADWLDSIYKVSIISKGRIGFNAREAVGHFRPR